MSTTYPATTTGQANPATSSVASRMIVTKPSSHQPSGTRSRSR